MRANKRRINARLRFIQKKTDPTARSLTVSAKTDTNESYTNPARSVCTNLSSVASRMSTRQSSPRINLRICPVAPVKPRDDATMLTPTAERGPEKRCAPLELDEPSPPPTKTVFVKLHELVLANRQDCSASISTPSDVSERQQTSDSSFASPEYCDYSPKICKTKEPLFHSPRGRRDLSTLSQEFRLRKTRIVSLSQEQKRQIIDDVERMVGNK